MLVQRESGKRLFTGRRIEERRGSGEEEGETKDARRTAFFLLIRLRRVMAAVAGRSIRFQSGAATRLHYLRHDRLRGHNRDRDRSGGHETNQQPQDSSHRKYDTGRLVVVKERRNLADGRAAAWITPDIRQRNQERIVVWTVPFPSRTRISLPPDCTRFVA